MRFLRKRFVGRTITIFMLLVFGATLVPINVTYALTGGPHQPEYTSYEEPGATDMVNLLTGDFTFSIPILEVPGPEGGFSLPLSYHAGIRLEQEASWVGLGWTINPGAIVRTINQYPDDASGEPNTVTVQDLTGMSGYDISWGGIYHQGWNSVTGKYGSINLLDIIEYNWGEENSLGIVGFHVGKKPYVDGQQFFSAMMSIASVGAASGVNDVAVTLAKQLALQSSVNTAVGVATTALNGSSASSISAGYWQYSKEVKKSLVFKFWGIGIKTAWKVWLDQTRQENMFGVLHLHDAETIPTLTHDFLGMYEVGYRMSVNGIPQQTIPAYKRTTSSINYGAASDVAFSISGPNYQQQNTPHLLATDDYMVNAAGITGSISPYRLEVGSIAMPREMSALHTRLAPVQFQNYKVPFIYNGSPTGRYFHHSGGISGPSGPGFFHGIPRTSYNLFQYNGRWHEYVKFDIQDDVLHTTRTSPEITNYKIPQENFIEWLTNSEVANSVFYINGFSDFQLPGHRAAFRSSSPNTIGAYSITSESGITYNFALPAYSFNEKTESIDNTDDNKRSIITRPQKFANRWLLTSITGPDYVDRNSNGTVDDNDWGFWVRMNYGRHDDDFDWRIPYEGTSIDPKAEVRHYTEGQKELYYLNSVETRSHVALFLKSTRADGRSAKNTGKTQLKLDEILLISRSVCDELEASYGLPDFRTAISEIALSSTLTSGAQALINANVLKRVVFNYDYSLSTGTPSSYCDLAMNPARGKLTLKSISIRGRSNKPILPDYKFQYGYNPNYQVYKWDGWGMYNSSGTSAAGNHKTNDPTGLQGAAWSLTKITSPLGSTINIQYERDSYSKISNRELSGTPTFWFVQPQLFENPGGTIQQIQLSSTADLSVGDRVRITGYASYRCPGANVDEAIEIDDEYIVSVVTPTSITLTTPLFLPGCLGEVYLTELSGLIYPTIVKTGGNIRVGSITMSDAFGEDMKTRYLYTNESGTTSGVVSKEPPFIQTYTHNFDEYLNYPFTPVLYGRVSVLNGRLSSDTDFTMKTVFEFETPSDDMYTQTKHDISSVANIYDSYLFEIVDRTSRIGQLKRIVSYDANLTKARETILSYESAELKNNLNLAHQGVFTSGVLLSELYESLVSDSLSSAFIPDFARINRTTLVKYPSILKQITTSRDGLISVKQFTMWDFVSGQVLEELSRSPLGLTVKTIRVPAYHHLEYSQMGSKAINIENKNMLTQLAEEYVLLTDHSGTNVMGLVAATATEWKKDWSNYRFFDGLEYVSHNEPASAANPVWRVGSTYSFKGSYDRLLSDGTMSFDFNSSDRFRFASGATNSLWQYLGEPTLFDHFSMPLEQRDFRQIYSAVKMGNGDKRLFAQATNARYSEIAFSSAEDLMNTGIFAGKPFFSGEIALGEGEVKRVSKGQIAATHTGDAALSLSSGHGFIFKTSGLDPNKYYRASVWANSTNGRIYYKINGGVEQVPSATVSQPVNGWYRLDLELPLQQNTFSLEIGVKSASGTVLFDDFRFQPVDASMTCYVYPPDDYRFTSGGPSFNYVLDNNNMYTKFEYDEVGFLKKTYIESFEYGVKAVSGSTQNYRRFHVDQ